MRCGRLPKILYLTSSDLIGGMERNVINVSREFTEHGLRVQTVFLQSSRSAALLAWARQLGVRAETSTAFVSQAQERTAREVLALFTFVRRSRADVVHLHYGGNYLSLKDLLAVRAAGRHVCVASIHSAESWYASNPHQRRKTRAAASLCDALIVHSKVTAERLYEAGVPRAKIHLAHYGLRPPTLRPEPADARARLRLPASAFVITTNARLVMHKGIGDLIGAVTLLADSHPQIVLVVAGDGPEREALERLSATRLPGRVRFLGHVADHADVYAATDLFVLPSWDARESFGMVFIEAAFHAIPAIGTAVGGIPEAVLDGRTGVLVPPRDPAALSRAIETLLADEALRGRLGSEAQRRALSEFTPAITAERYASVYQECSRRLLPRQLPPVFVGT